MPPGCAVAGAGRRRPAGAGSHGRSRTWGGGAAGWACPCRSGVGPPGAAGRHDLPGPGCPERQAGGRRPWAPGLRGQAAAREPSAVVAAGAAGRRGRRREEGAWPAGAEAAGWGAGPDPTGAGPGRAARWPCRWSPGGAGPRSGLGKRPGSKGQPGPPAEGVVCAGRRQAWPGARAGPALVTRGRGRGGCSRLGCTRRGGRGGLGLGLVDDRIAAETFGVGLAPDAIGLGVDDARRVAAHADAQRLAQVERLLVGEPELSTELVDPDLRCQSATSTPSSPRRTDLRSVYRSILARLSALRDTCSLVSNVESLTQLGDRSGLDRSP